MNGEGKLREVGIQLPESTKPAVTATPSPAPIELGSGTMSGPLVGSTSTTSYLEFGRSGQKFGPATAKIDVLHAVLRVLCLVCSVTGICLMVTAKQSATLSLYGFQLPVYSKWSFSDSFEYLVGVSAAVVAHSSLQLLLSSLRLRRKAPLIPSRKYAWLLYAGDQVFAYAMMSAASAAAGVTNLNRTGIQHTALPNFCKPLHSFCDRVAASVVFTLLGCFMLAALAVIDVVWLSNY